MPGKGVALIGSPAAKSVLKILKATKSHNFAAPGAVPGTVTTTVTVAGAAIGDYVIVSSELVPAAPENYILFGMVSAADTVTFGWAQVGGSATDPGGAATYHILVLKEKRF